MGELRWQLSPLVYQADGNAVFYLCRAWHTNPLKQLGVWEREGAEEKQLFDSDYSVLSREVLALEQFHRCCSGPSLSLSDAPSLSLTTRLSLVVRGSPDTHTIPFDKLRPLGNKIAVVGTALWHTAVNQVPGLLTVFVTSRWSPLSRPFTVSPLPTSTLPSLLCSRPRIWNGVSQEAPPDLPEFFSQIDIQTLPGNARPRQPTFNRYAALW